jgi:transposase
MVHDCWKSHIRPEAQSHQLCLSHLFRELNYFIETDDSCWAKKFKALLKKAINVEKQMGHEHYYQFYPPRSDIEKSLGKLLQQTIHEKHKGLGSFKKRMNKYKDFLLTFMYHPKVPPDNNGSERAIRNVKVKQKISGQFKNIVGAKQFAILRSVTDTAIKNSQNVLNALLVIANCEVTD